MELLNQFLKIKTSTLPGCGKGLFTKIFIPKGTIITEHTGRITSLKDAVDADCSNSYLFYVSRNHVIDAKDEHESFARYVNDANGLNKKEGLSNNSKYIKIGKRIFIEAIKDIPKNKEIFVSYGKEYWEVTGKNKKG